MSALPHFSTVTFAPVAPVPQAPANDASTHQALYRALFDDFGDADVAAGSRDWLQCRLTEAERLPCALPETPNGLLAWMHESSNRANDQYQQYVAERKAGAPRRFFANRSHALGFLRGVAPTKLVDGSWLHGVLRHWSNPRHAELVRTYIEELGDGRPDRNHVLLYRQLLARHGIEASPTDLPDDFYTQGAIQLALARHTDDLLPEVIGFNLGYEQLPLHLPITAYELNELGIDPYYFTLHVTVDNHDTGHAHRAVAAVLDTLPRFGDPADFWRRVRNGFRLNDLGAGTNDVIGRFDQQSEVERIFQRKSVAGRAAHADYCKVAGRSVNDWLSSPAQVPDFLRALEAAGWIVRNAAPEASRFWRLLDGDHAEMFGVFSAYELQAIQDWLRGQFSLDGAAVPDSTTGLGIQRPRSFRAQQRLAAARLPEGGMAAGAEASLDPDVEALEARMAQAPDMAALGALLVDAMAPSRHWMPAGLLATRRFVQLTGA
ncbi:iron-containing redox enzyme family protein [Xylophilus sp. Kf1]|nr:iron-containing redox enzyme family protein [Xylophilus sp. Kf1]